MSDNVLFNASICLNSLSVYRALLKDDVLKKLNCLLDYIINGQNDTIAILNMYNDFYYSLLERNSGKDFKSYVISLILYDDNVFSRDSERKGFDDIDSCLRKAAAKDLRCLESISALCSFDIIDIIKEYVSSEIINLFPSWDFKEGQYGFGSLSESELFIKMHNGSGWEGLLEKVSEYYRKNGSGIFAKYKGFIFTGENSEESLKGVEYPDPVRLSDLVQYDEERKIIIDNTENLLKGCPANNILLYGDRGTGKSTTVKALLNEYHKFGLRIIELSTMNLSGFPSIIKHIKDRPQKFIIFIDDLAFGDSEESYTALKAVLEGGLEAKPQNAVIYATSNRRHLVKERFSEREDELHISDTLQEKLALSDRFGITVTFLTPDRKRYLQIVEEIVKSRGLEVDKEYLRKEASIWETRFNGPSPRTAKQFADWLEGKMSVKITDRV